MADCFLVLEFIAMAERSLKVRDTKTVVEWIKETPAILFFVVFFLFSVFAVPRFSNPANLFNIVIQASDLIILACGMTFVFINGSIDFSVTAILPLASVLGAMIMRANSSPLFIILAILVMFLTGIIIAVINGISITRFHMPSFIATMATQLIFAGLALTLTQSKSIGGIPNAFTEIAQGTLFGIPYSLFITVFVVLLSIFLLDRTVYGKHLIAVGTNQKTALISGVSVKKVIFSIFLYSGILSSLTSILMTARMGAGVPAMGKDMLMDIIAAVVVGGTSATGGKGNLIGTVIAALFVVTLNNSLNLLRIDWYWINVCKGMLILVVALYSTLSNRAD
jgi:ribose transport system permease protein